MSRSNQKMKELFTGVHLVTVFGATLLPGGLISVRYSDGFNKLFDQNYSLELDKIFALKKLCAVTGTDIRSADFNEAISGKRLWIAIKEVHDGNNVDYYVFDVIALGNPEQRPIISGDPIQHPKGIPLGVFIEHKDVPKKCPPIEKIIEGERGVIDVPDTGAHKSLGDIIHPIVNKQIDLGNNIAMDIGKSKIISDAKEMIRTVEAKSMKSLNQPNNKPTAAPTEWDDF